MRRLHTRTFATYVHDATEQCLRRAARRAFAPARQLLARVTGPLRRVQVRCSFCSTWSPFRATEANLRAWCEANGWVFADDYYCPACNRDTCRPTDAPTSVAERADG